MDLLRFTTAGSVDDGKSTLIGRLLLDCGAVYDDHLDAMAAASKKLNRETTDLALLTDGLRAEREQGITIDVAYRYFTSSKRRFIIADTPGHEQYTRNMATGASTAQLAIVLVDAKKGISTQSKRHAFISSLLGIPHLAVAVNKMDLVDYSRDVFEDIRDAFMDFSAKLNFADIHFFPVSALNGDNVTERSANMPWYDGSSILHHLETVQITADRNLIDFRFPVQLVNRPTSDFRGYCGTIASGVVRVGDEVSALPSGQTTRIAQIHGPFGQLDYAYAGQAVTLCTDTEIDVSRGNVLAHPGNQPFVAREIETMLIWMADAPMRPNATYVLLCGTQMIRASVSALRYRIDPESLHRQDADCLNLNEIGRAPLTLLNPLVCDPYKKNRNTGAFILIDPTTNATVAAGMILDRTATPKKPASQTRPVSQNITRSESLVDLSARENLLGQRPATIWLTGLSGSGKSTIAKTLETALMARGRPCYVLDGDNVRHGLNRDLGFSANDRTENIRRISEVARLFNEAGLIVITAFISPYRSDRASAREIIGNGRMIEVHVDTPLEICEQRDPKGLYQKARAGEIKNFTGLTAPYEAPESPELAVPTGELSPEESVDQIIAALIARGIIPEQ